MNSIERWSQVQREIDRSGLDLARLAQAIENMRRFAAALRRLWTGFDT